jgi:hypothetical protein
LLRLRQACLCVHPMRLDLLDVMMVCHRLQTMLAWRWTLICRQRWLRNSSWRTVNSVKRILNIYRSRDHSLVPTSSTKSVTHSVGLLTHRARAHSLIAIMSSSVKMRHSQLMQTWSLLSTSTPSSMRRRTPVRQCLTQRMHVSLTCTLWWMTLSRNCTLSLCRVSSRVWR